MSEEVMYDLSQLREVAAGSEDFVNKMVDMFLNMTPDLVNRIKVGLANQDWPEVQSASHKMKPSIDMMGIDALKLKVREIEGNAKHEQNLEAIPGLVQELEQTLDMVYDQLRSRS